MTLLERLWGTGEKRHVIELDGILSARIKRGGEKRFRSLGVIARKKVTDAFVAYLVDSLQDSTSKPMDVFKYHDSGTGVGAENKTDTALGTPCGDARDEGTQEEGATGNIFKSVATHTYDETLAITEHGLFSASSSGTLMDRSVFSAINVVDTDQIEFTYQLTCTSES